MPKYGTKTYSRTRTRETQISKEFDELQKNENSNINATSDNTFTRKLPRKSPWARTSRVVEGSVTSTKDAAADTSKTKKKRKLDAIEEKDPFAFDEDDVTDFNSKRSTFRSNAAKLPIANDVPPTELTDDEAYSSSQELSENSSQGAEKKVVNSNKRKLAVVRLLSTEPGLYKTWFKKFILPIF